MHTLKLAGVALAGALAFSFPSVVLAAHGGGGHGGGGHGGAGFHGGGFHGGGFHGGVRWRGHGYGGLWWGGAALGALATTPYWYGYDYPNYGYSYPYYGYSVPYAAAQYWYYCQNPAGYYPYVQQCYSGWQIVPAG
jgi:hypothetical protein